MGRAKKKIDPQRLATPGLRTKVFIREDMLGAGKILLLKTLAEEGSIAEAARVMGLEYRRAWFLLDTVQRSFEEPLFTTHRGGGEQGGAQLTELGQELVARHAAFEKQIQATAQPFLDWISQQQKQDAPED
jgi:molybdate transport system regulatory protein